MSPSSGKCALLVAHPGHEMYVHGWLETTRPIVYVLTDGSGRANQPRMESSTRLLKQAGARPGTIYGRMSDRALYEAVLRQDAALFRDLAAELADEIVGEQFDFVLGDAAEGEILTHDVWRGVIDAALALAEERLERRFASYEFQLYGRPGECPAEVANRAVQQRLDDAALARKIAAARAYPELKSEVDAALGAYGEEAFRLECMWPAGAVVHQCDESVPKYERHGEKLVAAGVYCETVRFKQHVAPLLAELQGRARAA